MQYLDAISKTTDDLCLFPRQTIHIPVIQIYAPTSNAEEAEVERFYEDLQDLLELTPKKDALFITRCFPHNSVGISSASGMQR